MTGPEPTVDTESRRALHELIDALREADERWVSPEWNMHTADDVVDAHRALMHYPQWGLVGLFEHDPAAPRFHRIVDPDRKFLGDNPDAVYFDAPVSSDHAYRVRGETRGAAYVSVTVEAGTDWGSMDNQVVGVINDTEFDIDAEGHFEILLGGERQERNWLALPERSGSISTRHYFEDPSHAAADPARVPAMHIDVVGGPGGPGGPDSSPAVPGGPGGPDSSPAVPGGPGGPDSSPAVPGGPGGPDSSPAVPGGPGGPDSSPAVPGGPGGPDSSPPFPVAPVARQFPRRSAAPFGCERRRRHPPSHDLRARPHRGPPAPVAVAAPLMGVAGAQPVPAAGPARRPRPGRLQTPPTAWLPSSSAPTRRW